MWTRDVHTKPPRVRHGKHNMLGVDVPSETGRSALPWLFKAWLGEDDDFSFVEQERKVYKNSAQIYFLCLSFLATFLKGHCVMFSVIYDLKSTSSFVNKSSLV